MSLQCGQGIFFVSEKVRPSPGFLLFSGEVRFLKEGGGGGFNDLGLGIWRHLVK